MSGEQAEERTAREGRWEKLRKLAEKATPGPWKFQNGWHSIVSENPGDRIPLVADCCFFAKGKRLWESTPNGEYIAAADPQTILNLLSECSRLASRVEELEKLAIALRDHMNSLWRLGVNHAQFCKWHNGYPCDCILHGKLSNEHGRLDFDARTLAGAHAEEKS